MMDEENVNMEKLTPKEAEESVAVISNLHKGLVAILEDNKAKEFIKTSDFNALLERGVSASLLKPHPFISRVQMIPISHIEGLLDALFFGQWGTRNFTTRREGNEIVGHIELYYYHPITQRELTKTGAASVEIQVNALSKDEKKTMTPAAKSMHALSLEVNKKSNALMLGYPKLLTMCLKNAAYKIGKTFGRDINRDVEHTPFDLIPTDYRALSKVK